MTPRFGVVPVEIPVERSLNPLAPAFRLRLESVLAELGLIQAVWGFETLRTEERQRFLYGFGRDYDDGRGKVTNAPSALYSWHGFGLACDIVEKDATPWDAPPAFWANIGRVAEKHGLVWGGRWRKPDLPHVQWARCPTSPLEADRELFEDEGIEAVWQKYGAAPLPVVPVPSPIRR